jgi:hypothetical protein
VSRASYRAAALAQRTPVGDPRGVDKLLTNKVLNGWYTQLAKEAGVRRAKEEKSTHRSLTQLAKCLNSIRLDPTGLVTKSCLHHGSRVVRDVPIFIGDRSIVIGDLPVSIGDVPIVIGDAATTVGDVRAAPGKIGTSIVDVLASRGAAMTTPRDVRTSIEDVVASNGAARATTIHVERSIEDVVATTRADPMCSRSVPDVFVPSGGLSRLSRDP